MDGGPFIVSVGEVISSRSDDRDPFVEETAGFEHLRVIVNRIAPRTAGRDVYDVDAVVDCTRDCRRVGVDRQSAIFPDGLVDTELRVWRKGTDTPEHGCSVACRIINVCWHERMIAALIHVVCRVEIGRQPTCRIDNPDVNAPTGSDYLVAVRTVCMRVSDVAL